MKLAANTYNKELEQLLEAQELAEIGSFEWDLRNNTSQRSPQLNKILEISGDIHLPDLLQRVHPSDRGQVKEAIDKAITDSGHYDCEFRYTHGLSEKVLWSKGRVMYEDGIAAKIRGAIMNVTDRHYMIQRLQRSQELYKQAQSATHIGNWSMELVSQKINWSDELYRIFGLEPQSETISIERFRNFLSKEDGEQSKEQLDELMRNGGIQEYINRVELDDHKVKILQVKRELLKDEKGVPYKLIGTCQDITEKQLLIEKLERSEHFIKHIADASPTILYLFDAREGKIVYINNEISNILGFAPEEILDMGSRVIAEVYHPDDFQKIGQRLRKYKNEQKPTAFFHFECRMKHKNGGWRWMLMRETIFSTGPDQKISEILGAALDITERKQIEEELFQKTIELQQSNTSLEEFAYVASHDLQEPLRKISTFGDRLLSKYASSLNEDGKTYLDKIVKSTIRMQKMINDLLSVSTISGNKHFVYYNLQLLFEEVLQTLDFKLEESKATITSDDLPHATIVPSQFRQLFQNLISNSIKFSRKNGPRPEIAITHVLLSPEEALPYNLSKADRYLQLTFADNGIGFEPKFAEKIFVIFQRLHNKNEYEGTGIGLAICKKIVENHGGVISASGLLGQGATFTIVIPA